jgi:predicted dehydrogenase
MPLLLPRRDFLRQATLIGTGAFIASPKPLWALEDSPNERLRVAGIGVGGKGESDIAQAGMFGDVVALCDIDDNRSAKSRERFPKAAFYHDFRKLFDEMEGKIDAVVVSTPDHTHAPAAMRAIRAGKHVYCQKPLTWSVVEARALREAAAKHKVATQMGNQGTALDGLREAVEVIRAGAIGPVREVHVWTNRCGGYWKQAPDIVARPTEVKEIPKHVHWDEFLGPAPERPYHPSYHPFAWRGWRDFGTGALGDMACHTANMAFMALKLGSPTTVSSQNSEFNPETFQQWATITFQFPARSDDMPACKLVWYEGIKDGQKNLPAPELMHGEKPSDSGLLLVGDKGVLFSPNDYGASFKLLPVANFEGFKKPEPSLPRLGGSNDESQKKEWFAACKGGPAAMSNFEYAGLLTEAMLLGNVAVRAGKAIQWDGPNMKIPNAPEAEQYLHREYRKGWTL